MSLTAVSGYYDGEKIIPDEDVTMCVGQKVIISIFRSFLRNKLRFFY